MYYKETPGVEPWAADASGSAPADWMRSAHEDLAGRGLLVAALERVPIPNVPGRYALKAGVAHRTAALARCFVEDVADTTPAAATRTDCAPLHKAP
jgi:hypothetical protein